MTDMILTLANMPARPFVATEMSDIECYGEPDVLDVEETYVLSPTQDRLEAIGDDLYRIIWNEEMVGERGPLTIYTRLQHALEAL